jgi:alpha-L-fucosidase
VSDKRMKWFLDARFGLFVHYGLFSMLERGEWVMNRERISAAELEALAERFNPHAFDADRICSLAVEAGAQYVNLTTMHHEGFRLYETQLSDFNAMAVCGRDLVAEFVDAAKRHNLRVSLYHSLNNWHDRPDAVDALENKADYDTFIAATHKRFIELAERFPDVDCIWYDGWWPFSAAGWQATALQEKLAAVNPNFLFNPRTGLPGDFGTPEGHMSPPVPWRPWEACITGNDNWGYHAGDKNWKSPLDIIQMLARAAQGQGNLLFNIGPRKDGSIPPESSFQLREVGQWLNRHREAIWVKDRFTFGLMDREGHEGDWNHNGPFTRNGTDLYQIVSCWCGSELTIGGVSAEAKEVTLLTTGQTYNFSQRDDVLTIHGLPEACPDPYATVVRVRFAEVPQMNLTGGMRVPRVPHPPYDPNPSDIAH